MAKKVSKKAGKKGSSAKSKRDAKFKKGDKKKKKDEGEKEKEEVGSDPARSTSASPRPCCDVHLHRCVRYVSYCSGSPVI